MKAVYNQPNNNGYTEEATALEIEVREKLKHIIRRELDNNSSIESIEYVIHNAVHTEILKQKMCKLTGRNVEGQIID